MTLRASTTRAVLVVLVLALVIVLYALPALAASGSPLASGAPVAASSADPSAKPEKSRPPKPPKPARADKAPEQAVTLRGVVGTRTAADGDLDVEYTLTADGKVLTLDAGPAWFFKDKHPLAPFVDETVTIAGEQRPGSTEVDVLSVDGTVLREPGKLPWAGGWKRVGKDHPGWTQEKWDRWQAKAKARGFECFPPGQCRDRTKAATPTASGAPAGD